MQFIDLAVQQKRIRTQLEKNIMAVLDHGKYIMGPEVAEIEKRLAEYVGVKHAIGCSSGTDALLMALMAYNVAPGDAIFTTPFTFIATAEVINLLGATPVFVDIAPGTFNLDPKNLEKAIAAVNTNDPSIYPLPATAGKKLKPRGILPVDLFGLPADYDRINEVAASHGLFVIEDAAQSFGAEYKGKKACSLANIACTSFFPAKPLGCYGDGGMCFTDNDELAGLMNSVKIHGQGIDKYDNARIGINGRLDAFQAAVLNAKFDIFPEEVEMRDRVAQHYNQLIEESGCNLITPKTPKGYRSVWAQYSILAKDEKYRTDILEKLKKNGVPSAVYYPRPLHMQTAFENLGYNPADFTVSHDFSTRIFSLPMHPYLAKEDQERIVKMLT
ncbi:MAG: DegT/DnrJ/EryC1/StrS family aminotransferase [Thermodesulfobacteriota bacterium]